MKTLIKNEFRQTRRLLLIWLGIMLLLCGFCYFELLSLQDSLNEMATMVSQFPRLIMIMFGVKGHVSGVVLCGEGKEVRNLGIPVHKACGTENHCTGEGDRFGGKSAGVCPVQRFM